MSTQNNIALVRRWTEEVINKGNLALIDELFDADYVNHATPPGWPAGPAGEKLFTQMFLTAFPDGKFTFEDYIAEGDKVVGRYTYSGTHTGEFQGIPPTGKKFSVGGINIIRVANGRIAENWVGLDQLGLLQQLGVIPLPGQGGN
ncbi:MAG TPA: ester cyclase [Anaerolineae bacterium]|nr:ester cyclase [Anaerolineae bacterium]